LRDIDQEWPWLIYSGSDAWVIGFILFNQWRQRRHVPHYEEPLLAHVEWSIKDIEHRTWLERNRLWWYLLPIALGCMIPPIITFAMECRTAAADGSTGPWAERFALVVISVFAFLFALLVTEGVFAAIFYAVHRVLKNGERIANEKRRQQLQALRALRESLLNTEEQHT